MSNSTVPCLLCNDREATLKYLARSLHIASSLLRIRNAEVDRLRNDNQILVNLLFLQKTGKAA